MLEIAALNIYPVKSLRGIVLEEALLGVQGLQYDRYWMITDNNYHFVTQRQIPKMATISVSLTVDQLILEHEEFEPLAIDLKYSDQKKVKAVVWKDSCEALDEGDDASKWLHNVIGKDSRLVRFSPEYKRQVEAGYLKGEEAHTAFSDGYPFLITAEESLDLLNKNLSAKGAEQIPMGRFRPNIVIKGLDAFAEDKLDSLKHESGLYAFGLRKPCQRCKVTTVDQHSGIVADPKEPLSTLVSMNSFPDKKGAFFGQNSTLLTGTERKVSVGDRLIALEAVD